MHPKKAELGIWDDKEERAQLIIYTDVPFSLFFLLLGNSITQTINYTYSSYFRNSMNNTLIHHKKRLISHYTAHNKTQTIKEKKKKIKPKVRDQTVSWFGLKNVILVEPT